MFEFKRNISREFKNNNLKLNGKLIDRLEMVIFGFKFYYYDYIYIYVLFKIINTIEFDSYEFWFTNWLL